MGKGKDTMTCQKTSSRFCQNQLSPEELNEKIRKVAQGLYEKRGRVSGHELEDWVQAEKQVKQEFKLI